MYYVYLLKTDIGHDKQYFIGCTSDLRKRLLQHQKGEVKTTKNKKVELVYYEAYAKKSLAFLREKGLKNSGSVYNALMKRIGLK